MNADDIRAFLMQQPRPSAVHLTLADGQEHQMACGSQSGVGWKKLSQSIDALDWDQMKLFDGDGQLLRVTRNTDEEAEDAATTATTGGQTVHLPPNADPETARFHLVANLIAQAYSHSTNVAFQRLSELIQTMAEKAAEGDRARETFYRAHVKQLEAQIRALGQEPQQAGGGDLLMSMLGNMMGGMSAAQAKTNATNGAHQGD